MQALLEEAESKRRRKQEETKAALDKIRARISETLHGYHDERDDSISGYPPRRDSNVEICFENITDPMKLYSLLADVRVRTKYEKQLTVVIVQIEDKQQEKEKLLNSLDEFFQETKATDLNEFVSEMDDIDLDEATAGLEDALTTATHAATRLLAIEKQISQLLSIAAAYPDTKKGRKKLEKALVKAQEEVQKMSSSLGDVKTELEQSKVKCGEMQATLDTKTTECGKLRKEVQQTKKLQFNNDKVKAELAMVSAALQKTEEEVKQLQKKPSSTTEVCGERIKELELALQEAQASCKSIKNDKEELNTRLQQEIQEERTRYEAEMAEMKANHEEQLRSLVMDIETVEEEDEAPRENGEGVATLGDNSAHEGDNEESEFQIDSNSREAALKTELAKVKSNSRKITTSLKAQLAEAQLKLESHASTLEAINNLENQIQELTMEKENETADLRQQLQVQTESHHSHTTRIQELETTLQSLSAELQLFSQEQQGSPIHSQLMQSPTFRDLITRSTQWSDGVLSRNSPALYSAHSSPYSSARFSDHPNLIPMEEINFSSSPLSNRSTVLDGSVSLSNAHQFHGSPLHNGSLVNGEPGQLPLSGLATSHLTAFSNGSSRTSSISHGHPIIQEWTKAFEQVMRFKESVVEMLLKEKESHLIHETLIDLQSQGEPVATLENNGNDLSGQITQMRFTLALVLHQLETALREYLAAISPGGNKVNGEETVDGADEAKLVQQLATLRRQARLTEERHKHELLRSKETIATLSMKIESLKTELVAVRKQSEMNEKSKVVFFTRLDVERNKRALDGAVGSQQVTEEDYESMVSDMEDYLSLPGQRLQQFKREVQKQVGLKKAIGQVRSSSASPNHTSKVLTMIHQLQEKRRTGFANKMERQSERRLALAQRLQNDLTKAEQNLGVFLIKPMYPSRSYGSIMFPLNRRPPTCNHTPLPPHNPVHKRAETSLSSRQHPTLQLVTELRSELASRQAKELTENYGLSSDQQQQTLSALPTPRPISMGGAQWNVSASHMATPSVDFSPVLPRLVELEITRIRRPPLTSPDSPFPPPSRDSLSRSLLRTGTLFNRGGASSSAQTPSKGNESSLPPIHMPSANYQQQTVQ